MKIVNNITNRREIYLLFILISIVIIMSIGNAKFMTPRNLQNIIANNFEIGLISVSMTMVIIMGGMDMSVGSIAGFAGMLVGVLSINAGMNTNLAIIITLFACITVGVVNGLMVISINNANPMIVTIGMMVLLRAVCRLFTEGWPISGFQKGFDIMSYAEIGKLRITVLILFVSMILGQWILSKTLLGNYLYAIGNNERSAVYAGIKIKKVKLAIYIISAVVAGLAGIFLASRMQTSQPDAGEGYHMEAIAAIVIGGTSISGGEGNMMGTLLGFLIIASLKNGLSLMGVPPLTQMIFTGIVLIATIFINNIIRQREAMKAQKQQMRVVD